MTVIALVVIIISGVVALGCLHHFKIFPFDSEGEAYDNDTLTSTFSIPTKNSEVSISPTYANLSSTESATPFIDPEVEHFLDSFKSHHTFDRQTAYNFMRMSPSRQKRAILEMNGDLVEEYIQYIPTENFEVVRKDK